MGLCHHSFFIDHVLLQDETTFQCRLIIFNMDNNTAPLIIESHIAYLKVLHPTERLSIVQGDQVEVNEELEFEIEYILQNGTPPTELFWMDDRNTNIITNNVDNRIKIQEDKLWTIRSVLKITPKKIDHHQIITCCAHNIAKNEFQFTYIQLLVQYAPRVTLLLKIPCKEEQFNGAGFQKNKIFEGSDLFLECDVDANPMDGINYRWYLNNDLFILDFDSKKTVLRNVNRNLNGSIIKCVASNQMGTSANTERLFIVHRPQSIH